MDKDKDKDKEKEKEKNKNNNQNNVNKNKPKKKYNNNNKNITNNSVNNNKDILKRVEPTKKEEINKETIEDVDIVFETKKVPKDEINKKVDNDKPKKAKKKMKLSLRGIIILLLLFILVDTIFIATFITLSGPKKDIKEDKDIVEIDNNKKEEPEPEKEKEVIVPEKDNYNEDDERLDKLNHIDKELSFFKYNNLDRYLAYKEKNPNYSDEQVVVYVNIGLDNEYYTNIQNAPYGGTNKVLANKYYALDSNYEPNGLTAISSSYSSGTRKLTKEAAEAFNRMAKDAKEEGYTVRAVSTYRSYLYQKDLYNKYVNKDGKEKADTYSARPGHSEHQTGLAVDVDNAKETYTSFGNTKEFDWMEENAYKYGYILRYTKDNEWITGYKDEPWHYRYVGEEIATYIHNNPMTYEEYFVRFLDK